MQRYYRVKIKDESLLEDKYKETTGESAIITHRKIVPKTVEDRKEKKLQILFCYDFNIILGRNLNFKNKIKNFPLITPILKSLDNNEFFISELYVENTKQYTKQLEKYRNNKK